MIYLRSACKEGIRHQNIFLYLCINSQFYAEYFYDDCERNHETNVSSTNCRIIASTCCYLRVLFPITTFKGNINSFHSRFCHFKRAHTHKMETAVLLTL